MQTETVNELIRVDSVGSSNCSVFSTSDVEVQNALCSTITLDHDNVEKNSTPTDNNLATENEHLKLKLKSLDRKCKLQHKLIRKLKQQVKKSNRSSQANFNNTKRLLNRVFTENQIKCLLGTTKKVRWTNEELSLSFTLHYLSIRAYLFVKNKMNIPLPSLSCLRKWASTVNMQQGHLNSVYKFLKVAASKMTTDTDRICTLMFDEMKVKSTYEYDRKNDTVLGPFKYM